MANTNADVIRIELTNEADASSTLREKQIAYSVDTKTIVWKVAGGTIRKYWDATVLASVTSGEGSAYIGDEGITGVTPMGGSLSSSGTVHAMLVGLKNYVDAQVATADTFLEMSDTPVIFSAHNYVKANAGATALENIAITAMITGTTNQITVTNDGDGTVTLSTPQNIHTGASPTFAGMTLSGSLTLSGLSASLPVFTNAGKNLTSNAMTGTGSVVMSASPTLTGTVTLQTLNSVSSGGVMTLQRDDSGTFGPRFDIFHNSGSPAVSDTIGDIRFVGRNSAAASTTYARIRVIATSVTDGGLEAGQLALRVMSSGSETTAMTVNSDLSVTLSNYTADRIPYFSTGGLIAESANLKFDGSNLSVGSPTTSAKFHVSSGNGTVPSVTAGTVGIFQNNANTTDTTFVSILGGANGIVGVHFSDAANQIAGGIQYWNSTNTMYLHTNGSPQVEIDSTGRLSAPVFKLPVLSSAPGTPQNGDTYMHEESGYLSEMRVFYDGVWHWIYFDG